MIIELILIGRLVLAALMGSFIGLEREAHGRPAGLRTHTLVALGSCLIMLISIYAFSGSSTRDPARLAAQVVSGIGFLGAGTILREGASIRGLTTAATLWVVAGIGLAIGSGFYLGGVVTTIISVFTLVFLNNIEKKYIDTKSTKVRAVMEDRPGQLAAFCRVFAERNISIKDVDLHIDEKTGKALITVYLKGHNIPKERILEELTSLPGMINIKWR
ncbi:MAG TPA: MgtC/SapB family protein [Bacillota bacterium]